MTVFAFPMCYIFNNKIPVESINRDFVIMKIHLIETNSRLY